MRGRVKWFSSKKGYGFITAQGKDYFVHFSAIKSDGYRTLKDGEEVEFEAVKSDKGEQAANVVRLSSSTVSRDNK